MLNCLSHVHWRKAHCAENITDEHRIFKINTHGRRERTRVVNDSDGFMGNALYQNYYRDTRWHVNWKYFKTTEVPCRVECMKYGKNGHFWITIASKLMTNRMKSNRNDHYFRIVDAFFSPFLTCESDTYMIYKYHHDIFRCKAPNMSM